MSRDRDQKLDIFPTALRRKPLHDGGCHDTVHHVPEATDTTVDATSYPEREAMFQSLRRISPRIGVSLMQCERLSSREAGVIASWENWATHLAAGLCDPDSPDYHKQVGPRKGWTADCVPFELAGA